MGQDRWGNASTRGRRLALDENVEKASMTPLKTMFNQARGNFNRGMRGQGASMPARNTTNLGNTLNQAANYTARKRKPLAIGAGLGAGGMYMAKRDDRNHRDGAKRGAQIGLGASGILEGVALPMRLEQMSDQRAMGYGRGAILGAHGKAIGLQALGLGLGGAAIGGAIGTRKKKKKSKINKAATRATSLAGGSIRNELGQQDTLRLMRAAHRRDSGKKWSPPKKRRYSRTDPSMLVRKRERNYDEEHSRQRRLGAGAMGSALGGGALIYSGGRDIGRASEKLRLKNNTQNPERGGVAPNGTRVKSNAATDVKTKQLILLDRHGDRLKGAFAAVTPRSGGKVAGGLGLLATAGGINRYAHSNRNRKWD